MTCTAVKLSCFTPTLLLGMCSRSSSSGGDGLALVHEGLGRSEILHELVLLRDVPEEEIAVLLHGLDVVHGDVLPVDGELHVRDANFIAVTVHEDAVVGDPVSSDVILLYRRVTGIASKTNCSLASKTSSAA